MSYGCCRECGAELPAPRGRRRRPMVFCPDVSGVKNCKADWHNRRRVRGAMLYDLFMATRYQREHAVSVNATTRMSQLAADFLREDAETRDGRRSWHLVDAIAAIDAWATR